MSIDLGWSEEYDCIPLRLRRKMLHSIEHLPKEADDGYLNEEQLLGSNAGNVNEKQLAVTENCLTPALSTTTPEILAHQCSDSGSTFLYVDNSSDHSVDCFGNSDLDQKFEKPSIFSNMMTEIKAGADIGQHNNPVFVLQRQMTSDVPGNVLQDCLKSSSEENVQAINVKHEIFHEFDNSLDNITLEERRKMLVSRKLVLSSRSDVEEMNNGGLSKFSKVVLPNAKICITWDALIGKNINLEVTGSDNLSSELANDGTLHTANSCSSAAVSIKSQSFPSSAECKFFDTQKTFVMDSYSLESSVLPSLTKVKDEPLDVNELCSEEKYSIQNSCIGQTQTVKDEPGFSKFVLDELDHMLLVDRARLLLSGNPEFSNEDVASALDFDSDILESVKPVSISRPRKKRRTATDSVESALEEDVPGLLKVLLDRGVSPEEIKLYGEEDTDDILDDSLSISEDGFAELEAVISQLFSQRQTFLKFPLLRTNGEKVSYCLSCLLSLVEQTRYLRNRKWPVEWGWCRDLQSFIFVFHRHNRIVLERPEYGYATYFFELLNSVPVAWQVKRLVTAMKLTNCGRITLLENRPLVVGEDLSEGEARVLAEFGWTPNTGLGSMLNYCDRVVHDRKQELDSSEWKSKIGRQLMNGYNGGNIVAKNLPKRLVEYQDLNDIQVKVEGSTV